MKFHYFESTEGRDDDNLLQMAIGQGYVPLTCLLGGMVVMDEVYKGADPCGGCEGPRGQCGGRPRTR